MCCRRAPSSCIRRRRFGFHAEGGQLYTVGAFSFGYLRNFRLGDAFVIAPGAMVTVNFIDGRLESAYHTQTPVGLAAFIRLRPALMNMGEAGQSKLLVWRCCNSRGRLQKSHRENAVFAGFGAARSMLNPPTGVRK